MSKFKQLDQTIKETKTKVIFRKFPDGEIIALFPELPGNNDPDTCLSYKRNRRYGAAYAGVDRTLKLDICATQLALFRELTLIGYNLTVVTRFSYRMNQNRIAALRDSCA